MGFAWRKRSYCQPDSKLAQIVQQQEETVSCISVLAVPAVLTVGGLRLKSSKMIGL
ncbi:hypothetical protein MJ561_00360 [Klebsiella pneumoniae]|nr:hypothetical protein MJ561_00360 [Klebsiella pneumoniae]